MKLNSKVVSQAAVTIGFLAAVLPNNVPAAAVIYQATGPRPSDIQAVVDQFRRDIGKGGVNNGTTPGPISTGWREISGDDLAGISAFPAGRLDLSPKGTRWSTPAMGGFLVSDADLGPNDPNRNFGNINPSYATTFQTFESGRLIGVDSNVGWAMNFAYPGSPFRLDPNVGINAFGVVFSDVDVQGNAGIRIGEGDLATFFAPAAPGDGSLSFLGVRFDDGTVFNSLSIFAGNLGLSPFNLDGKCLGPPLGRPGDRACAPLADVVAVSLVIFPEPVPEASVMKLMALGVTLVWFLRLPRTNLQNKFLARNDSLMAPLVTSPADKTSGPPQAAP